MSFGFSPSDIIKLAEISKRVYDAFNNANDNSSSQVEALIKEFSNFHHCLLEVEQLAKEYGKELPLPYHGFKDTLDKCWTILEPYSRHLVDNRNLTFQRLRYTIAYIGKEGEIERLRSQIRGHCEAVHLWMGVWQARMHLEATKQTQRLLVSAPLRSIERLSTSNTLRGDPYEPDLSNDLHFVNRWLQREDDRIAQENDSRRPSESTIASPSSYGEHTPLSGVSRRPSRETPPVLPDDSRRWSREVPPSPSDGSRQSSRGNSLAPSDSRSSRATSLIQSDDAKIIAQLYHLQRELEDAIEEARQHNLVKDDVRHQSFAVDTHQDSRRNTQFTRRNTTGSAISNLSDADMDSLADSVETIRVSKSRSARPSPLLEQGYFQPNSRAEESFHHSPIISDQPPIEPGFFSIDWTGSERRDSRATTSSINSSMSVASPMSGFNDFGTSTAQTTPDYRGVRPRLSTKSLATLALGEGALTWTTLCRKVQVERATPKECESRVCDIKWRYEEDHGLILRAIYLDEKKRTHVWMWQHFPATGSPIPLTTTHSDGDVSIEFPKKSFGRLTRGATDIKYTFTSKSSSMKFQTLLYTNGENNAELLFDRRVLYISSNKNKPECRNKNIRLWKHSEQQDIRASPTTAPVLVLLFYTSCLPEDRAHWVEEPHYLFQKLEDSVYNKSTDKLTLKFSKDPTRWRTDKLFKRRKSSNTDVSDSSHLSTLSFSHTQTTPSLSTSRSGSVMSNRSSLLEGYFPNGEGNRYGYSELEIKFQSKEDRKAFVDVWRDYVRPLGYLEQ